MKLCGRGDYANVGEEIAEKRPYAPFFILATQPPQGPPWEGATLEVVEGLCVLEEGFHQGYELVEGKKARRIQGERVAVQGSLSINVLEMLGVVMATYALAVVERNRPKRQT